MLLKTLPIAFVTTQNLSSFLYSIRVCMIFLGLLSVTSSHWALRYGNIVFNKWSSFESGAIALTIKFRQYFPQGFVWLACSYLLHRTFNVNTRDPSLTSKMHPCLPLPLPHVWLGYFPTMTRIWNYLVYDYNFVMCPYLQNTSSMEAGDIFFGLFHKRQNPWLTTTIDKYLLDNWLNSVLNSFKLAPTNSSQATLEKKKRHF